jgi:hypothetical protein
MWLLPGAAEPAVHVEGAAGPPAMHARRVLEEGLRRRGAAFEKLDVTLRVAPSRGNQEAFSIRVEGDGGVRVEGGGDLGLAYGAYELLGQIESAPAGATMPAVTGVDRSPAAKVRSIALFLYNRDLEKEWFFSQDFWNEYFNLLVRARLNQFSLIYGHQTSYLSPLFPFLIDVPGYPRSARRASALRSAAGISKRSA